MNKVRAILLNGKREFEQLVAALNQRVEGVNFDLTKLPLNKSMEYAT
jgi:hypothetical protein